MFVFLYTLGGFGIMYIIANKHQKWMLWKLYARMKDEWMKLAQDLGLETNMVDIVYGQPLEKKFEPCIKGLIDGYWINIVFEKALSRERSLKVEIHTKTLQDFKFFFSTSGRTMIFMPLQYTGDGFFDNKFSILSTNRKISKLLFQEDFRIKIISVFTTNMQGVIVFEPLKDDDDYGKYDKVLDDNIQNSNNLLVYSESDFLMDNERQRLSVQRRLNFLLEMAKRIDSLEK